MVLQFWHKSFCQPYLNPKFILFWLCRVGKWVGFLQKTRLPVIKENSWSFLQIRSNEWGQDSEVRLIDASRNFHLAILLAHFSQNTEPMKKQIWKLENYKKRKIGVTKIQHLCIRNKPTYSEKGKLLEKNQKTLFGRGFFCFCFFYMGKETGCASIMWYKIIYSSPLSYAPSNQPKLVQRSLQISHTSTSVWTTLS